MMAEEEDQARNHEEMVPRNYQNEMFKKACDENTILYLPTGAGKTFISIMLMRHYAEKVQEPFLSGGHRIFFIAPKVALVEQQYDVIKLHTNFSLQKYIGNMGVDSWSENDWQQQFIQFQVLVMSAQILLDCLAAGFIHMHQICLLVVDECHHVTEDHAMNQILRNYYSRGCPTRILGLTATLIKRNVKVHQVENEVKNLERNMHSRVVRLSNVEEINGLYANPKIYTNLLEAGPFHPSSRMAQDRLDALLEIFPELKRTDKSRKNIFPINFWIEGTLMNTRSSVYDELKRVVLDLKFHIKHLGVYGGDISVLAHLINLQRMVSSCQDSGILAHLKFMISELTAIRKHFYDEMRGYSRAAQIPKFSSWKVRKLIEIIGLHLQDLKPPSQESGEQDTTMCGIVFVERRISAKVLYHLMKRFIEIDPLLKHLRPDFSVGANKNSFNTRESLLDDARKKKSIHNFNLGITNLIVASNVLEEGMDIQKCNLVIKFNAPVTFCSFVQSKGRARDQNAKFYVFDDAQDEVFAKNETLYQQIEEILQRLQTEDNKEENELYIDGKEFVTKLGAKANMNNSVKLVYRFCQSLSFDKFSEVQPLWFCKTVSGTVDGSQIEGFRCTVLLPLNSKYRKPIEGTVKSNSKEARCATALEAVTILYRVGGLDERLQPTDRESADLKKDPKLFPHWDENDIKIDSIPPGSKKKKRQYNKEFPSVLLDCAPTAGSQVYMHLISMKPVYPKPPASDNRRLTFYELLLDQTESLAILSSKKWPQLCEFPIFMNVGEITININVNYKTFILTESEIQNARHIHLALLSQLLNLNKDFLTQDFQSGNNNFLIVPTVVDADKKIGINWDLINQTPNLKQKNVKLTGNERDLHLKVISPWYRGYSKNAIAAENKNYVVTAVRDDESPDSEFPSNTSNYMVSYRDYYREKYSLQIKNDNQPLLCVKSISNKITCLNPRGTSKSMNRRRQLDMVDDFEEVLVPELCSLEMAGNFISAQLWLKVTAIPTVVFRATRLLVAEQLRHRIAEETQLGVVKLPEGSEWEPMEIDENAFFNREFSTKDVVQPKGYGPPKIKVLPPNLIEPNYPWSETQPVDLDYHMMEVTTLEIQEYEEYASKKLANTNGSNFNSAHNTLHRDSSIQVKPIAMLTPSASSIIGPQQHTIYSALTTTQASDSLDMERLESLGDSFLKFATCLYLFSKYDLGEGALTDVKGKTVGNRNLMYCGLAKNIPQIISIQPLSVQFDWKVPNLVVDSKLVELLNELELDSSALQLINLSEEEQESGTISDATWRKIFEMYETEELIDKSTQSNTYDALVDKHTVPDKCIADCVEAILGAYVESCGPVAASKLLAWFGILPEDIETVMTSKPESGIKFDDPMINVNAELTRHLAGVEKLEKQLDYTFKDRTLLLQALSHSSYLSNRITDSFQRLEFLGDAVLDFLITSHIYEQCGSLNPGQLTDLRSSLVNNITFASLAVRFGFYSHLNHQSITVLSLVENFVKYQEENGHQISEEYLLLLQEDSAAVAQTVDVPKVLGDIFESLAGAVFLDSGKNLATTWKVFYPLMKREIDLFSSKIPKQPVRLLYESVAGTERNIKFGKPHKLRKSPHVMLKLVLETEGKTVSFFGLGENKRLAKTAAAKCALKFIMDKEKHL